MSHITSTEVIFHHSDKRMWSSYDTLAPIHVLEDGSVDGEATWHFVYLIRHVSVVFGANHDIDVTSYEFGKSG
jgi:hypothetical protein